jgi:hypothetical protein
VTVDTRERPETGIPPAPRRRRDYGAWVIGAILVVVGGLWLLDVVGVFALRAAVLLPAVLAVVGLALVFGAWDGPHTGLVVFGVFLTVAVVAAAVSPPNAFQGGIGERNFAVTQQGQLAPRYDVGMGDLRLDLRDLILTETARVDVTVGAGEMLIQLPADAVVAIDASVGAGEINLLGESVDGVSVTRSYLSEGFEQAEAPLILDLDVGAGKIEVTR